MAGRPRGSQARNVIVPIRFTKNLVATLDANRGGKDRSAYIRGLVEADAERKVTPDDRA